MVQPLAIQSTNVEKEPAVSQKPAVRSLNQAQNNIVLFPDFQAGSGIDGFQSAGPSAISNFNQGWPDGSLGTVSGGYELAPRWQEYNHYLTPPGSLTMPIISSDDALKLLMQVEEGQTKSNMELIDEKGAKNGNLSLEDFKKAAYNQNLSPAARQAAKFFLDNPDEWRALADSRGKFNGEMDFASVETALYNRHAPINNVDAARRILERFDDIKGLTGSGKLIDINDFKAVLTDTSGKFDQRTKEAARFFVNNEREYKKLDVANDGRIISEADHKISHKDLNKYIDRPNDGDYRLHWFGGSF